MTDLGVRLNPITRLRLFQEARKHVFQKMDNDIITPERADEILSYVKENVLEIETFNEAKIFYMTIPEKFPELKPMKNTFEKEEGEKIDRVLVLFVEFVLNKGEFDLAEKILSEVNKFHEDRSISIDEIRNEMPDEFEKAVGVLAEEVTDKEV